jgi:threonine aldolase
MKPDDIQFARTKLLCLENTPSGRVLPLDYLSAARDFVTSQALCLHLDGARVFNAVVKLEIPVNQIAQYFDTISFCLTKGLGAPIGSLLCGSTDLIDEARRWRKTLGGWDAAGGRRQAGITAAAGLYALEKNVERLAEDHANAQRLVRGLGEIDELSVDPSRTQTNMIFVDIGEADPQALDDSLRQSRVLIHANRQIRLVPDLDVSKSDIETVIAAFKGFFRH